MQYQKESYQPRQTKKLPKLLAAPNKKLKNMQMIESGKRRQKSSMRPKESDAEYLIAPRRVQCRKPISYEESNAKEKNLKEIGILPEFAWKREDGRR